MREGRGCKRGGFAREKKKEKKGGRDGVEGWEKGLRERE